MSEPVTLSIPHELGAAEAKRRIAGGFARMIETMPGGRMMKLDERWDGDRLIFTASAMGQTIAGRVDVLDQAVRMELDLPPFLAALAGGLRGKLGEAGRKLLGKPGAS